VPEPPADIAVMNAGHLGAFHQDATTAADVEHQPAGYVLRKSINHQASHFQLGPASWKASAVSHEVRGPRNEPPHCAR
jgi:hypothetical protein